MAGLADGGSVSKIPEDVPSEIRDVIKEESGRGSRRRRVDLQTRREQAKIRRDYLRVLRDVEREEDLRLILRPLGWYDGLPETEKIVQLWRENRKRG